MVENLFASAVAGSLALSGGGSGLISVPTAQLMPFNSFEYQHTAGILSAEEDSALGRRQAGIDRSVTDHIQFAVIPRVEFGARLTTWYEDDSGRPGDRTFNDLSGHLKVQLLDSKHFRLSAGARDFSGEATSLSPAEFVVADAEYGPVQLTAGFGRADEQGVALDGVFGGVRYSPLPWLDVLVDHDGVAGQAGLNLHATFDRYSFFVKGYYTDNARQDTSWAAGVRVALGRQPQALKHSSKTPPRQGRAAVPVQQADALFEPQASDALAASRRQRLDGAAPCDAPLAYSAYNIPLLSLGCDGTVGWQRERTEPEPAAPHVQLRLDPVQRYAVGTEVGRMDYSIALRPSLQALLLYGFSAHVAYDIPLLTTDDYDDGGQLARNAHESGVSEVAAQYTWHAWPGGFVQASGGQTEIRQSSIDFARADLAMLLFDGRLGLHYSYTDLEPQFTGAAESQSLGKAFVWLQPGVYGAQLTAGRFLYQDAGARLDLYKYFHRTRLGLYIKADEDFQYVGMTVSVPLGSSSWGNRWISAAPTPHYQAFFETEIDSPTGENLIRPGFLREFHPQRNLLDDVLDQWRASPAYVRSRSTTGNAE